MTIEKAIEILSDVGDINRCCAEDAEALDMAIKALEQEPAEWIVDTDDSRRWDRVRFYCSSCNSWNTYGKSKYCPNCGHLMKKEESSL